MKRETALIGLALVGSLAAWSCGRTSAAAEKGGRLVLTGSSTIASSAVYWFDDTGGSACRLPESWRLLWLDGEEWKPVELAAGSAYAVGLDRFDEVRFDPVTTRALKLEVELQPKWSGGVLEWKVGSAP